MDRIHSMMHAGNNYALHHRKILRNMVATLKYHKKLPLTARWLRVSAFSILPFVGGSTDQTMTQNDRCAMRNHEQYHHHPNTSPIRNKKYFQFARIYQDLYLLHQKHHMATCFHPNPGGNIYSQVSPRLCHKHSSWKATNLLRVLGHRRSWRVRVHIVQSRKSRRALDKESKIPGPFHFPADQGPKWRRLQKRKCRLQCEGNVLVSVVKLLHPNARKQARTHPCPNFHP